MQQRGEGEVVRLLGGSEMYGRQTEKARTCVVHPRAGGGGGGRAGGNGGGGDRRRRRGGGGGDWRGRGGGGGGDRIVCGGGGAAETRRRDEKMRRRVICDFISVTRDTERCGHVVAVILNLFVWREKEALCLLSLLYY